MSILESQIFSVALAIFLSVGAANLTIELLIILVIRIKKLGAALRSDYSLESESLVKRLFKALKSSRPPINIDPDIMSGVPVFEGTRVPVNALIDNLAAGVSLDEFLENFPTVRRDQAQAVLHFSSDGFKRLRRIENDPSLGQPSEDPA